MVRGAYDIMEAMENSVGKKLTFSKELAYTLGLFITALGVSFMEKPDFGVSMVVAPAYLIYRKLNPVWSFFTFGTAEYMLQFVLLLVMMLVLRKFRISWFFSFVTAVIYGFMLDFCMGLTATLATDTMGQRLAMYIAGILLCCAGISLVFHTYIPPEVYELFVKEVSKAFDIEIHKFKTCYDISSMLISVVMSFCFFGLWVFVGVKTGTVVCALINGSIIKVFSHFYRKHLHFTATFPKLQEFFNK